MGLRGPIPKPTALKILEGNPGKRPLNRHEPNPGGVPQCPKHLDAQARREWRRLLPILLKMRVLTEADYIALANLCQTYSTMVKAQEQLQKAGLLYKSQSGYIQQSPLLSIVNSCVETITKLCREFGLTPSSRSRLTMNEIDGNKGDPVAAAIFA